jgi:5-(carboxyamino)imidazole ribonucleotide synthase
MGFPSNKVIGIIGGGQLGKMLIEASRPWNVKNIVLESDPNCPASLVADEVLVGGLYDAVKIRGLAGKCDVLTFEIEHIHVDVLLELEAEGKQIIPSPKVLKLLQDKGIQKGYYSQLELATAPYFLVENQAELQQACKALGGSKVVVKSRVGGYDGKGVEIVECADILNGAYNLKSASVVEYFYEGVSEFAVIVSRNANGDIQTFPLIEMFFNSQSNLVEFLFSPARISHELEIKCNQLAIAAVEGFNGVGLFAVELFVTAAGEVLINEIAPRPHNSGHHTIEGCYTSQFEQLNRILLDLPLGNTSLVQPAAMINLVGAEGLTGAYQLKYANELMEIPGVYVHMYNKKEIRPNRKMGHITVLANDLNLLFEKAEKVKEMSGFAQAD